MKVKNIFLLVVFTILFVSPSFSQEKEKWIDINANVKVLSVGITFIL